MDKYITGLIIICCILILTLILVLNTRHIESNLMCGFWKGDAEFCEQAGLEFFLLKIGENSLLSSVRSGYILAKTSDGLIMNNPIELYLSGGKSVKPWLTDCRSYVVDFDWLGESGYDFFPNTQELHYYPEYGKIVLCDIDQVYAILFKDSGMTSIAADASLMPNRLEEKIKDSDDI